jgi:NADH dehydrogenase
VILLEGADRVLPLYPESLSRRARKSLEKLGVQVRTKAMVRRIDEGAVVIEQGGTEEVIASHAVLWAAGMKTRSLADRLAQATGAEQDRQGRIVVDDHLNPQGHPSIYVVGDMAHREQDGATLPGIAPVAMQHGRYVARTIRQRLRGDRAAAFRYVDKGQMAVIGRHAAVCDLKHVRFGGWLAWATWLLVHMAYLIEYDNRLRVLAEWAWSYFTRKRGARLITGDGWSEGRK